ncbi:RadC family protein [Sporomusa aerivorans]|uniref:JAB domain-containing protein n=1 Tax=Sporomusa aerivorans TaxID=204936 RepID=UPI00352BBB16
MLITFQKLAIVKEEKKRYFLEPFIQSPINAADAFQVIFELENAAEEMFCALFLNTKNKIIGAAEISHGTLNASLAHPRELFKKALFHNAAAVIIGHNHPSGDPQPSREDVELLKKFREAGEILGISILDQIIIGGNNEFYSFTTQSKIT